MVECARTLTMIEFSYQYILIEGIHSPLNYSTANKPILLIRVNYDLPSDEGE